MKIKRIKKESIVVINNIISIIIPYYKYWISKNLLTNEQIIITNKNFKIEKLKTNFKIINDTINIYFYLEFNKFIEKLLKEYPFEENVENWNEFKEITSDIIIYKNKPYKLIKIYKPFVKNYV